jgi:hypothetical protein
MVTSISDRATHARKADVARSMGNVDCNRIGRQSITRTRAAPEEAVRRQAAAGSSAPGSRRVGLFDLYDVGHQPSDPIPGARLRIAVGARSAPTSSDINYVGRE